jgi:hypothetical protein
MADKFLLIVVKDIIINPVTAWETIDSEARPVKVIRNGFLLPSVLLVSISAFAGSMVYANSELSVIYSVLVGLKCFFLFYLTVFATSWVLKGITYPLDLGKNFAVSFRLITYSVVPVLVCQFFSRFFESLLFINVLALYSLYVFWTGAEKLLKPSAYKKMPLLIATCVAFIGIFVAGDLLFSKVIDRIYSLFFS